MVILYFQTMTWRWYMKQKQIQKAQVAKPEFVLETRELSPE